LALEAPERLTRIEALTRESQGWEIETRELRHWVLVSPASVQTRNKYRDLLGAVLDRAQGKGWIDANPVDGVPRAARSRRERDKILRREDFYNREEIERFLEHAPGPFEAAFWGCGFHAGLRLPGEALGLTWGAVDFETGQLLPYGNWVRNRADTTKGGYVEPIPMTPCLVEFLLELRKRGYRTADSDYIFTRDPLTGAPANAQDLRAAFAVTVAAAGLKVIPMYSARHSFGTGLAREGVDLRTIQGLMRHRRLSTTAIYMAYSPRPDLKHAVTRAFHGDDSHTGEAPEAAGPRPSADFWERLDEEVPAKWARVVRRLLDDGLDPAA
jgi:integrase